jgi:hypothetical protein
MKFAFKDQFRMFYDAVGDRWVHARQVLALVLVISGLVNTPLLQAGPPSDEAQYLLELINRARNAPTSEVTRLTGGAWEGTPGLNEGLEPGTISPESKPPIAFDPRLNDAALMNNLRMSDLYRNWSNYPYRVLPEGFEVDPSTIGETVTARCINETFPMFLVRRIEEHYEAASITSDRPEGRSQFKNDVDAMHEILFIDAGTEGRLRRRRILDPDWVLTGLDFGPNSGRRFPGSGVSSYPFIATQTFVNTPELLCVTGVVYHDWNGNGFYDMGEAAGSLKIWVEDGAGRIVAGGRTFPSGGYTILFSGKPPGTYRLFVEDTHGVIDSEGFNWTGNRNVKVDVVDPPLTADIVADSPNDLDMAGGFSQRNLRGWGVKPITYIDQGIRNRRPLHLHAALVNRGFSKALVQVNVLQVWTRRPQLRHSLEATNRGITEPVSSRSFSKTYTVQSGETIWFFSRVSPRRDSGSSKAGRKKPGLNLDFSVQSPLYSGSTRDRVVFRLKGILPDLD